MELTAFCPCVLSMPSARPLSCRDSLAGVVVSGSMLCPVTSLLPPIGKELSSVLIHPSPLTCPVPPKASGGPSSSVNEGLGGGDCL